MTTVRSQQKAQQIKSAHPDVSKDKLDFTIVEDISSPDGRCESTMGRRCPDFALAFDDAVISDPPFEAAIHTASPYHFNVIDTVREFTIASTVHTYKRRGIIIQLIDYFAKLRTREG